MAGNLIVPASRFGAALPANYGGVSGYEGANYTGTRDGFFLFPTDGRRELNRYTRVETTRKIRAIESNLPIVGRVKSGVGRKVVGKGLKPKPRTTDTEWNKENRRQFLNRASNPDVWSADGSMDFFEQTRFLVESRFGDGEGFGIFSLASTGMLQCDVRDPMECTSTAEDEALGWIDGIKPDRNGRARQYMFRTGSIVRGDDDYTVVPRSAVCHLRRVRRAKSLRSITEFSAGINSLIDVLDLNALITGTAKLHSTLGVKVKRNKGDAGKTGISGQLEKLLGTTGDVTKVSENFAAGAAIAFLAENEDIDLVWSEHPGPNILEFLRYLLMGAVTGTDVPFSVFWTMMGLGGAPSRIELDDAQDFFNCEAERVARRFCAKAYLLDTNQRIKTEMIPPPSDPEWWKHDWRGPAKITADKRNTAKSDIDRMHNGMLTWEMYFDELGLDAEDVLAERIEEIGRVMDQCAAAREGKGVPFPLVFSLPPGTQPAANQDDEEEDDDDEEDED